MSRYLIYALIDPISLAVRYVGLSSNGMQRPRQHLSKYGRSGKTYRANWLRALHQKGLAPYVRVIEEVETYEQLVIAERSWIAFGKAFGWPLTNLTDGGEGTPGRKMSVEQSAKQRRRALSPDAPWRDPDAQARAVATTRARLASGEIKRAIAHFSDPEVAAKRNAARLAYGSPMLRPEVRANHKRAMGKRSERVKLQNKIKNQVVTKFSRR